MGWEYKITVQDTGNSFYCAEDEAVIRAMFRTGSGPLKNGCCGGGCGICRMKIVKGDWRAFKPMSAAHVSEADVKQGVALLCCVQPQSDMVIAGL
ncbi:MAG: 2Fe-2S iron-sulfur cluster binding domain-containing protein [Treponema sp.]|jgi:ferredoxin|nr:2Fe-2S iron-sulfur cluster binding domain-containing protein [Treponema sp.]